MRAKVILSSLTACAVLAAASTVGAAVITQDFSGTTVPNFAYFQAGRDRVDGVNPLGSLDGGSPALPNAGLQDGSLRLPLGNRYYTRAKALIDLPPAPYTITVQFQYLSVATANCSFGVTFNDYGAESALPNHSVRMGDGIDGAGWKAIFGRTEAWTAVSNVTFAQPAIANDPMTLVITKTDSQTANISLTSTANGVLFNQTGISYASLGFDGNDGNFAIYNAAFGGAPFQPVAVNSVVVTDASGTIFSDTFDGNQIDWTKWLVTTDNAAIGNVYYQELHPFRPIVVGNKLQLNGTGDLDYIRAPLNWNFINFADGIITAKFDLTDITKAAAGDPSAFGIKFRMDGDETESVTVALDPHADTIVVGQGSGFNAWSTISSAAYTMGTGDSVYVRVTGAGANVTVDVANNPAFTSATTVNAAVAAAVQDAGGILFFNRNMGMIELDQFSIDSAEIPSAAAPINPNHTAVSDWSMF